MPIMTIKAFGQGEPDTIMSGIISLFQHGLYPIGIIVFLASIMVPILKIIGLIALLISVQGKITIGYRLRTRIYRWVEFFGKWSMLDVFVVSFLVALVNIGDIATVDAGLGVAAFCAMVIITIFAANSFDTRLIWDDHSEEGLS
jgi:paraquat-inducible protein A